jgi:hypothetical protein
MGSHRGLGVGLGLEFWLGLRAMSFWGAEGATWEAPLRFVALALVEGGGIVERALGVEARGQTL